MFVSATRADMFGLEGKRVFNGLNASAAHSHDNTPMHCVTAHAAFKERS